MNVSVNGDTAFGNTAGEPSGFTSVLPCWSVRVIVAAPPVHVTTGGFASVALTLVITGEPPPPPPPVIGLGGSGIGLVNRWLPPPSCIVPFPRVPGSLT